MAIKEVLKMGNPILRQVADTVTIEELKTKKFKQLIEKMFQVMEDEEGIGLAAPQIGISKQVAIVGILKETNREDDESEYDFMVIINPKIKILDETLQGFWEGCLSVPGLRGYVERPKKIKIDYLDLDGIERNFIAENFSSTVFQHEIDHLNGFLYIDKIKDTRKLSYIEEFDNFIEKTNDKTI